MINSKIGELSLDLRGEGTMKSLIAISTMGNIMKKMTFKKLHLELVVAVVESSAENR